MANDKSDVPKNPFGSGAFDIRKYIISVTAANKALWAHFKICTARVDKSTNRAIHILRLGSHEDFPDPSHEELRTQGKANFMSTPEERTTHAERELIERILRECYENHDLTFGN